MTPRTSSGLYPELPHPEPSAPPSDDNGFGVRSGLSSSSGGSRGVVRAHSKSPFMRNVRARIGKEGEEEAVDMEAISCLLDFATRDRREGQSPPVITTVGSYSAPGASKTPDARIVKTFRTSTPKTPAAAPRPYRPPRKASRRVLPVETPRLRALRRPPSAALGAPPQQEDPEEMEMELPDIPDTPQSPAVSDITILRLVFLYIGGILIFCIIIIIIFSLW